MKLDILQFNQSDRFDALIKRLNAACVPESGGIIQDAAHLPEMVVIPPGNFLMGSPETEKERDRNEGPQHQVNVGRFAIGKYPVTQRQWHDVMGDNPSYFSFRDDIESNADRPVEQVSWKDAKKFASRLYELTGRLYRLPTEAEWEYACRAGSTTAYPWGDTIKPGDAAFNRPDEAVGTSCVYGGRAKAFGLHGMIGNVWEMVEDDDADDYSNAPTDGSAWKDPRFRRGSEEVVKRGGSWDLPAEFVRCATRSWAYIHRGDELTGFRVAMTSPQDVENHIRQVVRGEVDPNGECLTLIYGDRSADDWEGGQPLVRFSKPQQGVMNCQFLISPDSPDLEDLLDGAYPLTREVLLCYNILPPWDYARHRCGGFSNAYGDWHWSFQTATQED